MSKVNELRTKRAKVWEQAKDFLDSHRGERGILSAEDTETYEKMEQEIVDLGREIERQEKLDAIGREMETPLMAPLTTKPEGRKKDEKTGTASDAYRDAFWAQVRSRNGISYEIRNALSEGVDSEGGYLVPDEFERTLVQALEEDNVIRAHAHVFTTSNVIHKIPVVATKGVANWIDEGAPYGESDDVFAQEQIDAHKVGTLIKVSEELLDDSAFDQQYISKEFTRRIGAKEEEAFLIGDGSKKPTGILHETVGAQVGVTAAGAAAIAADELIDLYYSLKSPYRRNAIWVLNDSSIRAIRKLKDLNNQYLWQPGLREGEPDLLLGKPLYTSAYMPTIAAGARTILFGDLSYYWIGDRKGITFKRLNERYADYGQVGFLASRRVDAKLILPEAVKVLQQKASS